VNEDSAEDADNAADIQDDDPILLNEESSESDHELVQEEEPLRVRAAWLDNLGADAAEMEVEHEWIGKVIKVWFDDKRKYFVATVWSYEGNDDFSIMYGNHRQETVPLHADHLYVDCENPDHGNDTDRWSFVL
jgi:hypothetical protein